MTGVQLLHVGRTAEERSKNKLRVTLTGLEYCLTQLTLVSLICQRASACILVVVLPRGLWWYNVITSLR